MNKSYWIVSFLGLILTAAIISLILTFGGEDEQKKISIGVIMPGNVSEVGWNGIHFKGIREAAVETNTEILLIEDVKENTGTCAKAIDSLVSAGVKMIILGSYNYSTEVESSIRKYPDIMFFNCSADLKLDNYKVYFARIYQARYLSGLIAGYSTKNNKIGYIAAMNNSEVNRGINAFTLGVRKINPKAEVFVIWTNSWDDAEKEQQNVDKLVNGAGVDVIAYHQNQDWILQKTETLGISAIGYNLSTSNYSPKVLTSVTTNWKWIYKEIIQDFLQKKKSISNYWVGIEKDAVGLPFMSTLVSDSAKVSVSKSIEQMKNGMDIFTGPIYDNQGKKRCSPDEIISDTELRENMDWFVKGVKIYEE